VVDVQRGDHLAAGGHRRTASALRLQVQRRRERRADGRVLQHGQGGIPQLGFHVQVRVHERDQVAARGLVTRVEVVHGAGVRAGWPAGHDPRGGRVVPGDGCRRGIGGRSFVLDHQQQLVVVAGAADRHDVQQGQRVERLLVERHHDADRWRGLCRGRRRLAPEAAVR